jgi:uncharacterized protein (DUF58 family)
MATFDFELLRRFEFLSLGLGRAGHGLLLAGPRQGPLGGGTEPAGLRDYVPGDDYRHVDWRRCARHDELLTKTFAGDEDRHVYILLDCSPSMGLGRPPKFQLAREIAALLGYLVLRDLGRLGVTAFSDRVLADLPPLRGKGRFGLLLRFLEQLGLEGTRTDLRRTAEGFVRRYQRHGSVVVISDLYDPAGFQPGFDRLRQHGYEPRIVQIHEPGEAEPALLGDCELFDVEGKTARRVTVTERAARRYRRLFAEFHASVRGYCARHGMACVQMASDTPQQEAMVQIVTGTRGR